MGMALEPRVLLAVADEMAGMAGEREAGSGLAILAAHAALESFVNETGVREIPSFKSRARFLPKWHDLCERVLGHQLDSAPDLERLGERGGYAPVPGAGGEGDRRRSEGSWPAVRDSSDTRCRTR